MAIDERSIPSVARQAEGADMPPPGEPSVVAAQAALAGLAARDTVLTLPRPGEMRWRLTMLLFPAILLVFVALYVSAIASGVEPEIGLLWAGGASIVLAMLGRAAVSILGDDTRLVLSDNQIVAMARSAAVRDHLAGATAERGLDGPPRSHDEQSHPTQPHDEPSTTAQTAGTGGKE